MASYRFTNKAVEDLADIWNYTFDIWSEKQADKYYAMLLDFCEELARKPEKGKKYFAVHPQLFGRKAGEHIIFYRIITGEEIEIVRILHSRIDLKGRMAE